MPYLDDDIQHQKLASVVPWSIPALLASLGYFHLMPKFHIQLTVSLSFSLQPLSWESLLVTTSWAMCCGIVDQWRTGLKLCWSCWQHGEILVSEIAFDLIYWLSGVVVSVDLYTTSSYRIGKNEYMVSNLEAWVLPCRGNHELDFGFRLCCAGMRASRFDHGSRLKCFVWNQIWQQEVPSRTSFR